MSGSAGCRELLWPPPGVAAPTRMLRPGRAGSASCGGAVPAWPSCISRAWGWVLLCQQKSVVRGLIILLRNQAAWGKAWLSWSQLHPGYKSGAGRISPTTCPVLLAPTLPIPANVPLTASRGQIFRGACPGVDPCTPLVFLRRRRVTYLGCSPAPSQPRELGEVYCLC